MDYTISEFYILPSGGEIYEPRINPEVRLKSMVTSDEMKRLSPSDRPYKVLAEIIDSCLIDDLGMSSYDLCIGDFQFLLHKLRVVTYGPEYRLSATCPYCRSINEDVINLDDLPVLQFNQELLDTAEFDLPVTKKRIRIKMQTPRMLDDVNIAAKQDKQKNHSKGDSAFFYNLMKVILTIDGERPGYLDLENFVKKLPLLDSKTILAHSKKLSEGIGLDLSLLNTCDVCGHEYETYFRTTSEFFGPTIDV